MAGLINKALHGKIPKLGNVRHLDTLKGQLVGRFINVFFLHYNVPFSLAFCQ